MQFSPPFKVLNNSILYGTLIFYIIKVHRQSVIASNYNFFKLPIRPYYSFFFLMTFIIITYYVLSIYLYGYMIKLNKGINLVYLTWFLLEQKGFSIVFFLVKSLNLISLIHKLTFFSVDIN